MNSIIDLSFKINGIKIPIDHSYLLFSSLSEICKDIHGNTEIGIHKINGEKNGEYIFLNNFSKLTIRCPERLALNITSKISNKMIWIRKFPIKIRSIEQPIPLLPCKKLVSDIVTLRKKEDPQRFIDQVSNIFEEKMHLSQNARVAIPNDEDGIYRRFKVKNLFVIGFPLVAYDLSEEDSLKLQSIGVGGRRRFGCGLFLPQK